MTTRRRPPPESPANANVIPLDTRREEAEPVAGVSLNDFHSYMPMHTYIYTPTREMWPASSVNARIPPVPIADADGNPVLDGRSGRPKSLPAATWIDEHKPVEQMTWVPGLPMLIRDRLVSSGGWMERSGVTCFNLYQPPTIEPGDPARADPWLDHAVKVFGDDADHIVKWLAHRVQRPSDKINHALVLGGEQGIGKDTLLEPVKHAVGPWNFAEVSPQQLLGRFNGFIKSVVLRLSEARDLGDTDRFSFYDHTKIYTAAPPDVLRVDEKNLREYYVFNCLGLVITTNHKSDGIYLPADDRRHFVAWSNCTSADFPDGYWNRLWAWYDDNGFAHVAAYLAGLDLAAFDAKAPPRKTAAFWDIVDANRAPEEAELADALDHLRNPDAATLGQIAAVADGGFAEWLLDRKNRRAIPHRLEAAGYVPVRNGLARDGLWPINGRRQVVYGKRAMSEHERLRAARQLVNQ